MTPAKICYVADCCKPTAAHGLCSRHYSRFVRHGDPNKLTRLVPGKALGFVLNTAVHHTDDTCLLWQFTLNEHGYGRVRYNRREYPAHKLVCLLVYGPPPAPKLDVAHSCGVRACCNPLHLRYATRVENKADELIHGTRPRGSKHGRAVLKESDVIEIKRRLQNETGRALAEEYGVSPMCISMINTRRSWWWLE